MYFCLKTVPQRVCENPPSIFWTKADKEYAERAKKAA